MKACIVHDSLYGNTEQIARAIGSALERRATVEVIRVADVGSDPLAGLELLIVGSPTQRFRPTPAIVKFLKGIPSDGLRGVKVAAFDTRLTEHDIAAIPVLAFFVRIFGYAAQSIMQRLERKGGEQAVSPAGFYVAGMEGPLVEGELERTADWAMRIAAT